jgi:hypothetical protein
VTFSTAALQLSEDAISPPPALSFAILTLVNDLDIPLPCVKALVDHVVSALATHPILVPGTLSPLPFGVARLPHVVMVKCNCFAVREPSSLTW